MLAVRRKAQTQTEAYWRRDFRVRPEDIEFIYDLMVDDGRPRTLDELTKEVIARHCRREAQAREPEQGAIYRPREKYTVGQLLFFPSLDYARGQVVSVRPGRNPRYGEFSVIQVDFEGNNEKREFAADLKVPHPLNDLAEEAVAAEEGDLSAEELFERYGQPVRGALQRALLESGEFVHADDLWFLSGALPEVHVGNLNLAEAVIDMAGHPLSTDEILREVDLPADANPAARVFALNAALAGDARFDNVGLPAAPRWFLHSLEPPAVATKPERLRTSYVTTGDEYVHRESAEVAAEIGDELDEVAPRPQAIKSEQTGKASFVLNYPHRREGTLPLTREILALFPTEEYSRVPIHFIDSRTDRRWMGWILPGEGYGWGLGEWYRQEELPVGATVELLATRDPYAAVVRCETRSRRSEWARVPRVEDGRLTFEIRKLAFACRYDRNLLLGEPADTKALDELMRRESRQRRSLFDVVRLVFPELSKLGSQGLVHAKALYTAVNVVWRSGAIPIFAELARHACFDPVGDGNWTFDDSLVGVVYMTPEEMETRPHSKRADLIRDRVLRYGSSA